MGTRALRDPLDDFNSIKVRLEPSNVADMGGMFKFQFHKGTIRTR